MKKKLTPKQRVLKRYPSAYAARESFYPSWAIFIPFRYAVANTPQQAWRRAADKLR